MSGQNESDSEELPRLQAKRASRDEQVERLTEAVATAVGDRDEETGGWPRSPWNFGDDGPRVIVTQ